jgi:hypothetical protein
VGSVSLQKRIMLNIHIPFPPLSFQLLYF